MQANDAQTLVLCALAQGPLHGYAINAAIEELTGTRLGPGSLYGALTRLEAKGLVESLDEVDRARPVRLTAEGRRVLEAELRSMARVAAAGLSGARRSSARAAVSSSMASTLVSPSVARRSLRAADQPIDTWSSCMAEEGMESTLAGTASRLSSDTMAAWVYWAIMCPESTPGSAARNGGSPCERALSSIRSVRRSAIEATSAAAIARKSST